MFSDTIELLKKNFKNLFEILSFEPNIFKVLLYYYFLVKVKHGVLKTCTSYQIHLFGMQHIEIC